jgi:hypothetical protein
MAIGLHAVTHEVIATSVTDRLALHLCLSAARRAQELTVQLHVTVRDVGMTLGAVETITVKFHSRCLHDTTRHDGLTTRTALLVLDAARGRSYGLVGRSCGPIG